MKNIASVLSLLLVLGSCSDTPQVNNQLLLKRTELLQKIIHTDDSLLHGVALGMKLQEVKKLGSPGDSLSLETADYLLFEGRLNASTYYTWDCEFDSAGLMGINLDVYLMGETGAEKWLNDFKAYFTDKYGPAKENSLGYYWDVTHTRRPARIELQEDTEYPYPKLSIYFYDLSFAAQEEAEEILPDSLLGDTLILP